MVRKLLIAGIDPGTTVGYAILDANGELLKLRSSKELELKSLVSETTNEGTVLAVGTDKRKCPAFVERFAVKTGAVLVTPRNDLTTKEKRELTAGKKGNEHEMDALASARYAFKKIGPVLHRIDSFARKNKKEELADGMKELVVRRGISIKAALGIIEKPQEGAAKEEIVPEEKRFGHEDYIQLRERHKRLIETNKLLNKQNKRLKREIKRLKEKYEYLKRKISQLGSDDKMRELLDFREKRIEALYQETRAKNDLIAELEKEVMKLNEVLSYARDCIIAKKLDNLGWQEFTSKNRILNIKDRDIILVEDADIYSEKTIEELKDKVEIMVCKKISEKVEKGLRFIFIDYKRLKIKEDRYFAVIDKESFEEEKKRINIIARIVQGYKEGRGQA